MTVQVTLRLSAADFDKMREMLQAYKEHLEDEITKDAAGRMRPRPIIQDDIDVLDKLLTDALK